MLPRDLRQYANRKLFIALGAVIAITFFTTIATIFTISTLLIYRQGAQAHNDNRIQLEKLVTNLGEAESCQSGYILTGDPKYLEQYRDAEKMIPNQLQRILAGTKPGGNYDEAKKLDTLTKDILRNLSATVALRAAGDEAGAVNQVRTGQGLEQRQQLRKSIKKLQDAESAQLSKDRNNITGLATLARDISIVSLLAVLGLSMLVVWTYLKAIQSERKLDQAKDEFVSLASHQLRTPATGIKSILSTLLAGDFGPLNDRQKHFLRRALESNERELNVIEELLNVAKADAGRLVLHATRFDLAGLVTAITNEQGSAFAEKEQELDYHPAGRPIMIMGDHEKLYMAIGNLVDNARKYTPEGGKISVSVSGGHGNVRVQVSDSGIGIKPEDITHIFDRFHRAGEAIQGHTDGAGLGLYLAGRIAELHNGTIEVTSRLGKGTKFAMILPQGDRHVAESSSS